MISPREAVRLIERHCPSPLGVTVVSITDALDHVLAEDVRSPIALPAFDNSAMDGYALRSGDTTKASAAHPVELRIMTTVFAGDTKRRAIGGGEACRIMTGAPLPDGANTVIAKEQALVAGTTLTVKESVPALRHVRRRGEEVKRGATILKSGQLIHPGVIGCLATVGKGRVKVFRKPSVAVIATGDETVAPGKKLAHGQIYDSNSHMVAAMLRQAGIEPSRVRRVKDHATALSNSVGAALKNSDVLIVIGGVSVGERDYLRSVLERHRVREVFWRVKQKPGKPLFFGVRGKRLVFGLPGNPASAFTCFYIYVYAALMRMAGVRTPGLSKRRLAVGDGIVADPIKWLFLKGKTDPAVDGVVPLAKQGSHMLTSLAEADSLIVVPPNGDGTVKGGRATTLHLPYAEEDE